MSIFKNSSYRTIYIVESIVFWEAKCLNFDILNDLVLTYDLAVKKHIESLGGECLYFDHLVDNYVMQQYNFLIYNFFKNWHYDSCQNDIFQFKNVPFGFSFRLEIWNDFVFYARTRICLQKVLSIKFYELVVGTKLKLIESILDNIGHDYSSIKVGVNSSEGFYFPIHNWMDEKIRYHGLGGLKYKVRDFLAAIQGTLMASADRWLGWADGKKTIFIQEYHPTRSLVHLLRRDSRLRIVLASFSRTRGWDRYVPVWGKGGKYRAHADMLMQAFRERRCARLVLPGGIDLTDDMYTIFEQRISQCLVESLNILDSIINYFDNNIIDIEVLIANIGKVSTLVDCVCKYKKIPSFMIINGLLNSEFLDEAKYATVINSYSKSLKENYFKNMDNVVCLGDPRMDEYCNSSVITRTINRECPVITIGASGHNNTDLNSYLAVEFDFLYDVLIALKKFVNMGNQIKIRIKIRANGYLSQYEAFCREFFPGFVEKIYDERRMFDVLQDTDFYISIYSQTLFEASCLGIPCVYFKKDTEIMYAPFDGMSELVTVETIQDLISVLIDFKNNSPRFDLFLDKKVMEKYIGPLDGNNLQRNSEYIYNMLSIDMIS